MFRFHKTTPVLSLFHAPQSAASNAALKVLQEAKAAAESTNEGAPAFELNVVEESPTETQLKIMMQAVGKGHETALVDGAMSAEEAVRVLGSRPDKFKRPVLVDWDNGKVVAGGNTSALQALVDGLTRAR